MENSSQFFLAVCLLGYAGAAAVALLFQKKERLATASTFGLGAIGATAGLLAAIARLVFGDDRSSIRILPSGVPFIDFTIRLDALGAFFLLIISVLALSLSIYSLGYVRTYFGRKNVGILGAFFNTLLLATTLVFLADNAFFFLIAWEIMALSAYCLVSFEHEQEETRRAGVLFFIMSHIGTGCLILGFLLLFQNAGDYSFAHFYALADKLPPLKRDAAFLLFLIGFGVKAGIVPLHPWLPAAHPVAPSNVSALMSGVLIKTGIYGMTRVFFDFLGTPANWWGVTVLGIGIISAVLGVLYALMQHDLKRLLAYHSIENIGIILMGLGAAMLFLQSGHPALATLALIAGLYHTMNHAVFKALLFLGAGAVLHATHTRDMEKLGGLVKCMPKTAFFFLVGAVAISALPPLNGFVSEWLTYQSLLQGLDPVAMQLTSTSIADQLTLSNGLVLSGVNPAGGTVSTLGIAIIGICLLCVPFALRLIFSRDAKTRIGPTWDCGLQGLTPQMEYTATGFSKPIRMIFKALFRPHREVQREYDFSPYFAKTIRFEAHVEEVFETRIYRPFNRWVLRFSRRMRTLQAGSIHAYLIYIFITLIVLLLFAL